MLNLSFHWGPKNWCFQTVVLETLENPLNKKETKWVNLKGNQPWIFIGRTDTKLKLQYFGHLMPRADSLERALILGKIESRRGRHFEMIRWHHRFSGHEFEQTPEDSEGQTSWACCSPWSATRGTRLSDWTTTKKFSCYRNLFPLFQYTDFSYGRFEKFITKYWENRCRISTWEGKCNEEIITMFT